MLLRRITGHLGAVLFSGALLTSGCSSESSEPEPAPVLVDEGSLLQTSAKWTDAFGASLESADLVEVSSKYLAEVSPSEAAQLAVLLDNTGYTHTGIRRALAGAYNELGRYPEALAQLNLIIIDPTNTVPTSNIQFLRAMNSAGIDSRVGVMVQDEAQRGTLIASLLEYQPATGDGWSEMYRYQLGVVLFIEGRLEEALSQFIPLIDANFESPLASGESSPTGQLDASSVGSALNLTVTAFRGLGNVEQAEVYLQRTIRFDDRYQLNYAGRYGSDTDLGHAH